MKHTPQSRPSGRGGFTLTELLVASSVSVTVVTVTLSVYIGIFKSWRAMDQRMQADRDVNLAVSHMIYGVDSRRGLRAAREVTLDEGNGGWTLTYRTGGAVSQTNSFTYSSAARTLVFNPGAKVIGRDFSLAQVNMQSHALSITMRVDRVDGSLQVCREIGTQISWRN